MQKTFKRTRVWSRSPQFAPETRHKILQSDEVCVVNPTTKLEETHIVNTYKEESVIDPHLRASDFSLEVQIRAGVQLKDCGRYFTPENPEQYTDMIAHLSDQIQRQIAKENVKPEPVPEPVPEPAPEPAPKNE